MATRMAKINGAPSAPAALPGSADLPERLGYRLKRRALGPPLTTDQIEHETLSKKLALGVLSSDCISSSAYGSEEILLILIPMFGLAAYTLFLSSFCWSPCAIGRLSCSTPRPADPTSWHGRTSARSSPRWQRSRSWSTTSSPWPSSPQPGRTRSPLVFRLSCPTTSRSPSPAC